MVALWGATFSREMSDLVDGALAFPGGLFRGQGRTVTTESGTSTEAGSASASPGCTSMAGANGTFISCARKCPREASS